MVLLAVAFVVGIVVRLILLPTNGFRDDLDQFAGWIHHIAVNGLGTLYGDTAAGPVTFGPVMGYIWAALAAINPGFAVATDASDVGLRVLMKLPATLADLGIAGTIAFALRDRPRWATVAAAVILLHPAVIDLSAWWGQYESIYMLAAVVGAVLAVNTRNGWAAAAVALALMTKPQAAPLLVPFAAWFWATGGWRGIVRATAIGVAVATVGWLPFLTAGGPVQYLVNVSHYQDGIFAVLSLRAWNVWWLVQEAAAGGAFIVDNVPVLGPLTLRHVGYATTVLVELVVALAVVRAPKAGTLFLALAASVLVAFMFLTQMHERYAYGAVVFLALLLPDPRIRWLGLALGIMFTLNLLAAVPPTPAIANVLPIAGVLGVAGSVAILAITVASVVLLPRMTEDRAT